MSFSLKEKLRKIILYQFAMNMVLLIEYSYFAYDLLRKSTMLIK